jgi:hypothetical protein
MPCMSDYESHDAMNMASLPTDIQKWYEKHREWDKSQGR